MTLHSSITFFLAVLLFSITPGPGIFAILARALSQGTWSCFSLALGMSSSDVVYLVLACYGLATLAEHYSVLFHVIRFVGAAYLIYLAYRMWTASIEPVAGTPLSSGDQLKAFLQGFLISASNPKVILFYIAFLPTFMDLSLLSTQDVMLASGLTLVALMIGLMAIAATASWARRFFQSSKAMHGLNRVAGTIMASAGVYIAMRS